MVALTPHQHLWSNVFLPLCLCMSQICLSLCLSLSPCLCLCLSVCPSLLFLLFYCMLISKFSILIFTSVEFLHIPFPLFHVRCSPLCLFLISIFLLSQVFWISVSNVRKPCHTFPMFATSLRNRAGKINDYNDNRQIVNFF